VTDLIVATTWRERLDLVLGRRRERWIVIGLVAVVALGALALWSRGRPAHIAPPATSGVRSAAEAADVPEGSAVAATAPPAGARPAVSGEVVLVHVAGAVRRPGLYELAAGARVADAIRAAGGAARRADLDALNLAEQLVDAQKVDVPRRGEQSATTAPTAPPTAAGSPAVDGPLVNINTADQAALEAIPDVGPVTAAAILEYRAQIGSFTSIDQLLDVSGIGPVTLENMRPYVTL
jgi:competence protein ComEA